MTDVQLKIVDGPDAGREFPIAGSLVIGRDPSAGIVLDDSEVSRRHASISAGPDAPAIEDLGSTNGTFVNGERIEGSRPLQAGDRLRIGTTVLEVDLPVQATQIASVIPEAEDPGATRMASVTSPEEAERAAKAEEAMRHAAPEGEDDEATVVPEDRAATEAPEPTAEQPPAPPEPTPPAPAPPAPAGGPQSPAPGPPAPPPPPSAPPPGPPPVAQPPGPPPPGAPFGGAPPAPQPVAPGAFPQPAHAQPPAGYQAGPGFQVRGPGEQWALCALVPFYAFVWYYRLCKEIGEWSQGRIHTDPGTSVVAITLGSIVVVPWFISMAGTMGRVRQCQQMAGLAPTASFGGFFGRLLLFGFGYKWLTEQLNELAVRRPVQ